MSILRRLRIPFLVASLAFLGYAIFTLKRAADESPEIRARLDERFNPYFAREQRERDHERDLSYAARLRVDAYARIEFSDFDGATKRLDDAIKYDAPGEAAPEVQEARRAIADNRAKGTPGPGGSQGGAP